jgi:hypothetical protein
MINYHLSNRNIHNFIISVKIFKIEKGKVENLVIKIINHKNNDNYMIFIN